MLRGQVSAWRNLGNLALGKDGAQDNEGCTSLEGQLGSRASGGSWEEGRSKEREPEEGK